MSKVKLSDTFIKDRVKLALAEDLYPHGDITSSLLENNKIIKAKIVSNQKAVVAGLLFAKQSFKQVDKKTEFIFKKKDGSKVKKNSVIAIIKGKASSIMIAERVALNFLSHISGIATKTNKFVKLAGKKCKICCTRKTLPNYTVEVDSLKQLKEIIGLKFNTILFDNMSIINLRACVKLAKKYYETEASGNINLKTVKSVAATGVNRISIGSITHSAPAVDFKLEI